MSPFVLVRKTGVAARVISRPALINMLPLVVVMAALMFTSRPQQVTKLPLVAVIAPLMFTSRAAFSVRVVGMVERAVQVTASLIVMSPKVPVVEV